MPTVTIETLEPGIAGITLDRPARLNALTYELVRDLHDALDEVGADPECKVVVLTGAGRGFCSGLDLRDFGTPPRAGEHRHANAAVGGQEFIANLTVHLRQTPQIVIAAVNGPAAGGGLSIAAACDIRVASRSATFTSAFIKTGLTGTDVGITYLLPRLIGMSRAFDMIVTGRTVDAEEADRMGLVSRVVDDGALHEDVLATARQVASYTRPGLLMTKEVMWANIDVPSMTAAITLENRNQQLAILNPEVQAFMASYSSRHRKKG